MQEVVTIIGLIAFVVFVVVAIRKDKKKSDQFAEEFKAKYPAKDSFILAHVTEKGELLYYYPTGDNYNVLGYKKWILEDIGYISTDKKHFSLLDHNKQPMCGEYITPSESPYIKEKADDTFKVERDQVDGYVEFIKKHGPHIQHMKNGIIQE